MKYLPLILGLFIVMSLLVGCSNNPQQNNEHQNVPQENTQNKEIPQPNENDNVIIEELNNTIVNDTNLDVGTLY